MSDLRGYLVLVRLSKTPNFSDGVVSDTIRSSGVPEKYTDLVGPSDKNITQ